MSSGATDFNLYALFQAVSLVMGVVALFYTMKGIAGLDATALISHTIGKMAEKLTSSVFEGLTN